MTRFFLSEPASEDLADIRRYLRPIPEQHTRSIRKALRSLIEDIGRNPARGAIHSEATRFSAQVIQSRVLPPYRVFYRGANGVPEIIAILHTARDVSRILRERLQ